MPWFVIYTKSRSEKKVAIQLKKKDIEVYCPLRMVKRKWSDRVKLVEEPLFKSYCFVNLDEADRAKVFGVAGVVGYLFWLKKPAVVKPHEIDLIKAMLNDFDHEYLEAVSFSPTDRVQVNSGPFMDEEGEVVATQGRKIVLRLESMAMSIEVDTRKTKVAKLTKSGCSPSANQSSTIYSPNQN